MKALKSMEEAEAADEQMQQLAQQAQIAELMAPIKMVEKLDAEILKLTQEANLKNAQAEKTSEEADQLEDSQNVEELRVLNDIKETANQSRQLDLIEDRNDIEREKIKMQERNKAK